MSLRQLYLRYLSRVLGRKNYVLLNQTGVVHRLRDSVCYRIACLLSVTAVSGMSIRDAPGMSPQYLFGYVSGRLLKASRKGEKVSPLGAGIRVTEVFPLPDVGC